MLQCIYVDYEICITKKKKTLVDTKIEFGWKYQHLSKNIYFVENIDFDRKIDYGWKIDYDQKNRRWSEIRLWSKMYFGCKSSLIENRLWSKKDRLW